MDKVPYQQIPSSSLQEQNIPSDIPKPSNNRLKIIFIVIIAVLVISSSMGGYFLFLQQNKPRLNDSSAPTPVVTFESNALSTNNIAPTYSSNTTPDITIEPTEEPKTSEYIPVKDMWKRGTKKYSNPNINISFDYPSLFNVTTSAEKVTAETDPSYCINFLPPELYVPVILKITDQELWDYTIGVVLCKHDNPSNKSLYDFIAEENKTVSSAGIITGDFNDYKKDLTITNIPHKNAYSYKGPGWGESYIKRVYFINKSTVYEMSMSVGRGVPLQPTPDGEALMDNMLKSVEFK